MAEGWAREWIRERPDITTIVASIALDSTAVYANSNSNNNNCCCTEGEICELKSVKSKAIQAMAKEGVDISKNFPKTLSQILSSREIPQLPIDFLVVLCSCGVENNLSENCRHVRQWHVEAPTAVAKLEGNDHAYRRVSLEIRERVHKLMEELHREGES